jgi:apolipoprotein N-acyltransferase
VSSSHPVLRLAAAGAAGVFLALVGPPSNLYPALWLGMAALAYLVDARTPVSTSTRWPRLRRSFEGGGLGLAFGVGANLVFFRFVPATIGRFTGLPFAAGALCLLGLALLQGLSWAAATLLQTHLSRRGVPSWVSFAIGVYAGTFVPGVFRWTPAGPLSPLPEMIQLAELIGERGVTLLMALSAGLLATALRQGPLRSARTLIFTAAALALPLLAFAEGKVRIMHVERDRRDAPTIEIGLVEASLGAVLRWEPSQRPGILAGLVALTESAENQGALLTIWSEGVYPFATKHGSRKAPDGARAVIGSGVHGPVLGGFTTLGQGKDEYNSAAICTADGVMGPPQDKMRLLAFGEELPIVGRIPWVRATFKRGVGLVAGSHNVVQASGPVRASVLICVEDTLPEAGRDAMADRPNLLVNLTNDAWFEGSRESELHLRMSALRSVESRRDMVRAVNVGPTSWIDAAGVVVRRYDGPPAGVLMATPALLEWSPTLYDRFGDVPVALVLAMAAAARVMARTRRRDAVPS